MIFMKKMYLERIPALIAVRLWIIITQEYVRIAVLN